MLTEAILRNLISNLDAQVIPKKNHSVWQSWNLYLFDFSQRQ